MASSTLALLILSTLVSRLCAAYASFLNANVMWDSHRAQISPDGEELSLAIDKDSGSGVKFEGQFHFGRYDVEWKMPGGNTAGLVATFYLQSPGNETQDEIDLEFLGNTTGEPYVLHTNVYGKGEGGREQQFYLWFDPTDDFHTYTIIWNPFRIVFLIDGMPVREHRNVYKAVPGFVYPTKPMSLYATIWNAGPWAELGPVRKGTDFADAPYVATYRNFTADSCAPGTRCDPSRPWWHHGLDRDLYQTMQQLRKEYMIYDYCNDPARFEHGVPPECAYQRIYLRGT